ncbi:MAG: hypothetical protein Q7J79_06660, partial [Gemmatimonadales bacterium]|nr:hypothetical protein [Gemmatimonadales bacterium]
MSSDVFRTMNAGYAQAMYEQYLRDPGSVDEAWRQLFENGTSGLEPLAPVAASPAPDASLRVAPEGPAPRSPLPAPADDLRHAAAAFAL